MHNAVMPIEYIMNKTIEKAIELSKDILELPLGDCSPSDDLEKQWAFASSFRDIAVRFISLLARVSDPQIEEMLKGIDGNIDTSTISEAHILRSKLIPIIDYLNEIKDDKNYYERMRSNNAFVDEEILLKLRNIKNPNFDLSKLIRFLEELNEAYRFGNYLSSILILRAIMNHIPPIFGLSAFSQIVAQSPKSIKSLLSRLEEDARPIADLHTHMMIRKLEHLPTKNQIEPYKSSLEILLNEIINKLE
jgi:hypothetical protein